MKHGPNTATPPAPDLSEHLKQYAHDTTHALVEARIEGGEYALTIAAKRVRADVLFGAETDAVVAFLEEMAAELAEARRRGRTS